MPRRNLNAVQATTRRVTTTHIVIDTWHGDSTYHAGSKASCVTYQDSTVSQGWGDRFQIKALHK